jgi:transcriptional regulator with XRE-family HTH domain
MRITLALAVAKAREAAGYSTRTAFAKAVGKSIRSINALEAGDPTVGQSVLFAVARVLPNWTEDTPKTILEGGPIPPTVAEMPRPRYPSDLFEKKPRTQQEEDILAVEDMGDEAKWKVIFGLRRRDYDIRGGQNDRRQTG